jgi:hypothetical protein
MKTVIGHIRANLIAYLALFVALGGTSYAAITIPRNSVGTRQLRNGAVTAGKLAKGSITSAKLDGRSIAGYVAFWARIDQGGQIISSSEPAHTNEWSTGNGTIVFRGQLSSKCFALANVTNPPFRLNGYVNTFSSTSIAGKEDLEVFMSPAGTSQPGPLPVVVAEICP